MRSLDFIFKEAIPPQNPPTARRVNVSNPGAYQTPVPQPAAATTQTQPDALGRITQLAGTAPETPGGVFSSDGKPVVSSDGQQVQAGHTVPAGSPGAAQTPNAGSPPVTQPVDPNNADADDLALGQTMTANAANAADQKNLANLDMQVGQGTPRAPAAQAAEAPPEETDDMRAGQSQNTPLPQGGFKAANAQPSQPAPASSAAVGANPMQPAATAPAATTPAATPAATTGGYPGGISQADAEKKYGKTGAEIIRLGGMDAYNKRPKDAAGNLALLKQLQTGQPAAQAATTPAAPSSDESTWIAAAKAKNPQASDADLKAAYQDFIRRNDPRQGRGVNANFGSAQSTSPGQAAAPAQQAAQQPSPEVSQILVAAKKLKTNQVARAESINKNKMTLSEQMRSYINVLNEAPPSTLAGIAQQFPGGGAPTQSVPTGPTYTSPTGSTVTQTATGTIHTAAPGQTGISAGPRPGNMPASSAAASSGFMNKLKSLAQGVGNLLKTGVRSFGWVGAVITVGAILYEVYEKYMASNASDIDKKNIAEVQKMLDPFFKDPKKLEGLTPADRAAITEAIRLYAEKLNVDQKTLFQKK